jgi:TonB family protein
MKLQVEIRLCVAVAVMAAPGCFDRPSAAQALPPVSEAAVPVYSSADGLTAPRLIPVELALAPVEACRRKEDGKVSLFFVVDTAGVPRNITFDRPLGSDLDRLALRVVGADRFNPGTLNANPVAVAQRVEVSLKTCRQESKDSSGKRNIFLRLRSIPDQSFSTVQKGSSSTVLTTPATLQELENGTAQIYKVGGSITPPMVLNSPQADFTDDAREHKISGTCVFSLIVDSQGMPQDLKLIRALGYGLDENAAEAVHQYRFKPAMKNGEPVSVRIGIEVTFRRDSSSNN